MAALRAGVASALTLAIGDPISGRRKLVGIIASLLAYLPISIFINFIVVIPASLILRRLHLVRWYFWMPLAIILAHVVLIALNGSEQFNWGAAIALTPLTLLSATIFRLAIRDASKRGLNY